jgi:hypothetical protein
MMKPIDVGALKVSPFVFDSILELKIEKKLNEHETLYVSGIIKDEQQMAPVFDMTDGTPVICENDGIVYFNGLMLDVKITCVEEVYSLEAYAVSNTIKLDTEKHKRSFQDNSQTYQSIVETVIAGGNGSVAYNAKASTVENIILQYNETDWELAKRLASHTGDVLIPIVAGNPSFHFGATDAGGASIVTDNYSISKEFRRKAPEAGSPAVESIVKYGVETDEFLCGLGERFNLNGNELRVREIMLTYVNSALTILYTLTDKRSVSTPRYCNKAITGLVLDGSVIKVQNDHVKLHLRIDEKQDEGKAHLFAYATGYSMESHTGWYVMPEDGDTAQLMFPNEDEKYAYAASSVRQEQTGRTGDHMVKYLRTSFGKEIKLDKNEILITALDDVTFIRINEDEKIGVEIITPHPILVKSGSTLNIESADDMTIVTEKNLRIQAKESIEMVNAGNVMKFIPDDGIAMSTDKRLEALCEGDMAIESQKALSAKSGKDMKLDSGAGLTGSAQSRIELACDGSSVILQKSGIDVKGMMIKQN